MNSSTPEFEHGRTEYQDEWLSAYLDDELTEDQRQIVETRLAHDPAAVETLSDLRRIRDLVCQIPGWQGADLEIRAHDLTRDVAAAVALGETQGTRLVPMADPTGDNGAAAELNRQSQHQSLRSKAAPRPLNYWTWLKPLGLAASLLAVLGLVYGLWQAGDHATNLASSQVPGAQVEQESDRRLLEGQESLPSPASTAAGGMGGGSARPASRSRDDAELSIADDQSHRFQRYSEDAANSTTASSSAESALLPSLGALAQGTEQYAPLAANAMAKEGDAGSENRHENRSSGHVSPSPQVFVGRSATWNDEAWQAEFTANGVLNNLAASALETSGARLYGYQLGEEVRTPSPVVVASIPGDGDGEKLFEKLITENSLVALVDTSAAGQVSSGTDGSDVKAMFEAIPSPPSPSTELLAENFGEAGDESLEAASRPSDLSLGRQSADGDLGAAAGAVEAQNYPAEMPGLRLELLAPKSLGDATEMLSRPNGRLRGGGAVEQDGWAMEAAGKPADKTSLPGAEQSIVLFLSRQEAERILSEFQNPQQPSRGLSYLWITPTSTPKTSEAGADRVILLLNSSDH